MTQTTPRPAPPAKPAACPICGKPAQAASRPFCSPRCADLDLHRWLGGVYRIESDDPADPPAHEDN